VTNEEIERVKELYAAKAHSLRGIGRAIGINYSAVRAILFA
jgi:hypothetical protein